MRHGGNTIVVISGANSACDAALVNRALASADAPGILLLQHEIPEEVNAHAIRAAHAAGWFIVLNPAPARPVMPELLPLIDIIAPNETEAVALTGSGEPHMAARHLLAQGAGAALVTLGGEGALYRDANNTLHCRRRRGSVDGHDRRRRCLHRCIGRRIVRGSNRCGQSRLRRGRRRIGGDTAWCAAVAGIARRGGGIYCAFWRPTTRGDRCLIRPAARHWLAAVGICCAVCGEGNGSALWERVRR